ncbi:hypothetical protein FRC06_007592, partial [Ceratobasidium sp. 370]
MNQTPHYHYSLPKHLVSIECWIDRLMGPHATHPNLRFLEFGSSWDGGKCPPVETVNAFLVRHPMVESLRLPTIR